MKRTSIFLIVVGVHLAVILLLWGGYTFTRPGKPVPDNGHQQQPLGNGSAHNGTEGGGDSELLRADAERLQRNKLKVTNLPLPPELATMAGKSCKAGVLVDFDKQQVLWAKAPDTMRPIASLTKMMTALMLDDCVRRDPQVTYKTKIPVTPSASKIGGRQVWLDPRETFSLDELMKCMMIHSANDVAYLVGEYLGDGDMEAFLADMQNEARSMGLKAKFYNPNGLPPSGNREENMADPLSVAFMAYACLQRPVIVKWSSTRMAHIRQNDSRFDTFNLVNTNKLITTCEGVNGMKTGYTKEAGYCVAATCERDGRRLVAAVFGFSSSKRRNDFVAGLLDWAYENVVP